MNRSKCAALVAIPVTALWALALLAVTASAQELRDEPLQIASAKDQFVRFTPPAPVTVAPGRPRSITLRFEVEHGDHVNSSRPNSELLIPTRLRLTPPTDLLVGKIAYPTGRDLSFPFAPDEKLSVYTGPFVITALVSADRTASPGRYRVHGELSYQACNDRACFPPKHLPVAFDVRVRSAPGSRHNPAQSPHVHR
jgi:hypothetical protein